jgi:hypothetical protein
VEGLSHIEAISTLTSVTSSTAESMSVIDSVVFWGVLSEPPPEHAVIVTAVAANEMRRSQ